MRVLLAELYASDTPGDTCPDTEDGPVCLHPMPVAMGPRTYLEPCLEPGLHFHKPPDLATIRGYILAMDAGTPGAESRKEARGAQFVDDPKGMAAAIIQDEGGVVIAHTVVRGPGTAQEGEAHAMNSMIRAVMEATDLPPADSEHAIWGVGDSQSAESATRSYAEDPKAHCMMSGISYQVHGGEPISLDRPLNIVVTPSHRFTSCNRGADKTVLLEHNVLGHCLLRRPFHFAPPEVQGDQFQQGPKALSQYLQRKNTADLVTWQKDNFGPSSTAWKTGRGVPIEWFSPQQQRHVLLQRAGTVPTMTEVARRMLYRDVMMPGICWFCGQPDTRQHVWNCVTAIHVSTYLRDQLRAWIQTNRYKDEQTDNRVAKETWGSDYLMVWAMATATEGFRKDSLSVATKDSMGMQFLKHTVDASVKLHQYRYTHREPYFREA